MDAVFYRHGEPTYAYHMAVSRDGRELRVTPRNSPSLALLKSFVVYRRQR